MPLPCLCHACHLAEDARRPCIGDGGPDGLFVPKLQPRPLRDASTVGQFRAKFTANVAMSRLWHVV